jgi:hypothetical protein
MIDYEELDFYPDDMIMVYNANISVECEIVKLALEKNPMPEIFY